MAKTKRVRLDGRLNDSGSWVGPPALVNAENESRFAELSVEVEAEIAPKNIFDRIAVHDISSKIFEEQELRGFQTKIITSARVHSLAALLAPAYGQNIDKAAKVAQDYFGSAEAAQRAAKERVRDLGISIEDIDANALHMRMTSIQTLDEMIDRRETGRNRIIKQHLKRQRKILDSGPAANSQKNTKVPKS